jgi:hypothetical protein
VFAFLRAGRARGHDLDILVRTSKIDAALNELSKITPPGTTLNYEDIARFCGCSQELIRQFELRALKTFRARLLASLQKDDRLALLVGRDVKSRRSRGVFCAS